MKKHFDTATEVIHKHAKSQLGCGYCKLELTCKIRDPKINKAKIGCKDFTHHES